MVKINKLKYKIYWLVNGMLLDFRFMPTVLHTSLVLMLLMSIFNRAIWVLPVGAVYVLLFNYFHTKLVNNTKLAEIFNQLDKEQREKPLTIERVKKLGRNFAIVCAFAQVATLISGYALLPPNEFYLALVWAFELTFLMFTVLGLLIYLRPGKYYLKFQQSRENRSRNSDAQIEKELMQ